MSYFTPSDAESLVQALHDDKYTSIWYRDLPLTLETAQQVGAALRLNTALSYLWLGDNDLSGEGFAAICSALKVNRSLTKLQVAHNPVGDEGVKALQEVLPGNDTLRDLEISHVEMTSAGLSGLAEAIEANTALTSLNIFGNDMTDGLVKLAEAVEKNESLIKVVFNPLNGLPQTKDNLKIVGRFDVALIRNTRNKEDAQKAAYDKIQLSVDTEGPWKCNKLMVVGGPQVGKTSLVRALTFQRFQSDASPTMGIDVLQTKTATWSVIPDEIAQERYTQEFVATSAVDLLATEKQSKSMTLAKAWRMGYLAAQHPKIQANNPFQVETQTRLQNIESDKLLMKVDGDRQRASVKRIGRWDRGVIQRVAGIIDKAAKEAGVSVRIWDFSGNEQLRAAHGLFLSKNGTYLLVFDVREMASSESSGKDIINWLDNIKFYAPVATIVLVGICKGEVSPEEMTVADEKLRDLTSNYSHLSSSGSFSFYPVDNSTSTGITELRGAIRHSAVEQDFVQQRVSINWLRILDGMLWEGRHSGHVTFDQVLHLASMNFIMSRDEVIRMLHYFHEIGVIVFFANMMDKQDIAIVQPQKFLSEMYKLFTLSTDSTNGVVSKAGLQALWDPEQSDFLLALFQDLGHATKWQFAANDKDLWWFPIIIQGENAAEVTGHRCVFDFSSSYLVEGAFERLACAAVELSIKRESTVAPQTNKSSVKFWVKKNCSVVLRKEKNAIGLYVEQESQAGDTLQVFRSELGRVRDMFVRGLDWEILVQVDGAMVDIAKAQNTAWVN